MNNILTNALKNYGCTPTKRLGLSHKRRRSASHQINNVVSPTETMEDHGGSESKIKKQNNVSSKVFNEHSEIKDNIQNKSKNNSKLEESILEAKTKTENEIKELKILYSVWANGCKNALLYLISLLEKRQGESVNVKQLLKELKIWEIMSHHFKNDADLAFFISDNEGSNE